MISPTSQEKAVLVTTQGLYEFCVMPFDLTKFTSFLSETHATIITGLNTAAGQDFMVVYIDDIPLFSLLPPESCH